jgi:hypothetical protein
MPIVLASGLLFTGCSKDEMESPNSSQPPSKTGQSDLSKSSYTNEEKIAMAGDVKNITHVIGTEYDVHLYGSSTGYDVTIDDFYTDSLIVLTIDDGTTKSKSTHDIINGKLDIENDAVYYFSSLKNDSLHSGSSALFRITLAVISHHIETPRQSASFVNNGSSDIFPEHFVGANCFWCTSYDEDHSIGAGLCITIATQYIFWMEYDTYQCGDAYPCGHAPDPSDEC